MFRGSGGPQVLLNLVVQPPWRKPRIHDRIIHRRGEDKGYEIGLGVASKADFVCNQRCQTSPVDLKGGSGHTLATKRPKINDARALE